MTAAVCPNCGLMLTRLEEFNIGPLHVSGEFGMVTWRGEVPHMSKTERLIVLALASAKGRIVTHHALYSAGGFDDIDHPDNQLAVLIHRINKAFRVIDPGFDRVRSQWAVGYRWAVEQGELAHAA